jgi:iron-sulfur cluster insertion protein
MSETSTSSLPSTPAVVTGDLPLVTFTEDAIAKVAAMIEEDGNPKLKLRIYVTGGGCSGLQYGFAFDEQVADDDFEIRQGCIGLLVDAMSMDYLRGAEVGFADDLEGARFVIKNPNASTTCGCGSSFSA